MRIPVREADPEKLGSPATPLLGRRRLLTSGLCAAASVASGCSLLAESASLSYALKVTASVGERSAIGASVIKLRWVDNQLFPNPGPVVVSQAWGQSPSINLGDEHGYIFALLTRRESPTYYSSMPTRLLAPHIEPVENPDSKAGPILGRLRRMSQLNGPFLAPREEWPTFVTFADLDDPKTVREIDPNQFVTRGGSVANVERVEISITRAPVTQGLERTLPWLEKIGKTQLDGQSSRVVPAPSYANELSAEDFQRAGF